jgi:sigma-E factor negative regulatory protein RseC
MEAVARVVAVGDGRAQLTCHVESSCKSCGAGRGCGLRLLARDRNIVLDLPRPVDGRPGLVPGQTVTISIPDDDVLRAAALAYLPALLGLLAGALIGHWLGEGDGAVALAGLLGAAGGWRLARGRARRQLSRVSIRPPGDTRA